MDYLGGGVNRGHDRPIGFPQFSLLIGGKGRGLPWGGKNQRDYVQYLVRGGERGGGGTAPVVFFVREGREGPIGLIERRNIILRPV